MKALDINLKVSQMLVDAHLELTKQRETAVKALFNGSFTDFIVKWTKSCELRGQYDALVMVWEMLLDCDEINAQYEAEAEAEEEDK